MTKLGLIWTTITAAAVGVVALVVAYFYPELRPNAPQEPQQVAETETAAEEETIAAQQEVTEETSEEASEATAEADTAVSDGDMPSFDVVGVEPTGDAVIAGRAGPGSFVELIANGEVVGSATASEKGEWAIVLGKPFEPGEYDVSLQVKDSDGNMVVESDQHLAISVPQDSEGKPLVVLNTPDGPSNILQKPASVAEAAEDVLEAAGDEAETLVAAADEAKEEATAALSDALTKAQGAASTAADTVADAADDAAETAEAAADSAAEAVADAGASAQGTADEAAEAVEEAGETVVAAVSGAAKETADAAKDMAQDMASGDQASDAAATADATSDAVATEEVVEDAAEDVAEEVAEVVLAPVTVEAVEAEQGKVYVAGTANPGNVVQVYVGDDLLGTATTGDNGRWLVEGERDLEPGEIEVRADMLAEGGEVASRAAVSFDKEPEAIVLTKAVASGEGGSTSEGAEASVAKELPNVIIRKGDNLWTIARRLYGDGFRYTTIYQANKEQIRDPDLIYPGQIFLTPESGMNEPNVQ